jgi:bifunctional DNA-binding transcriptional regulator/antitoxin component of YhaV-PrlF toxin-antitoxin module
MIDPREVITIKEGDKVIHKNDVYRVAKVLPKANSTEVIRELFLNKKLKGRDLLTKSFYVGTDWMPYEQTNSSKSSEAIKKPN